jgi:hypothetical protein
MCRKILLWTTTASEEIEILGVLEENNNAWFSLSLQPDERPDIPSETQVIGMAFDFTSTTYTILIPLSFSSLRSSIRYIIFFEFLNKNSYEMLCLQTYSP